MKPLLIAAICAALPALHADQAAALDQPSRKPAGPNKHPAAQWFPDAGLGLFIHWGLAGTIDLLWFDGGHGEISNNEVRRLQPGIVINRRNGGGGDYGDSEGKPPAKRFKGWFETCETCWPSKKWSYTEDAGWDTAPQVITELVGLRAWGGNLLANVGPMGDGSVPAQATAAWREMAEWMKHSRESVIGAGPGPFPESVNVPVTTREGVAYLHFLPGAGAAAVWKNAPKPVRATLLRSGVELPFTYQDKLLRIELHVSLRSGSVDVVKLDF